MTLSLYNKYRPQVFWDVVGQDHVQKTLANAVEKNRVSHAYLFCGPRGTGKTTTARILAKALLCVKAPTASPCGTCEQCTDISEGIHSDVYELDAASRTGVDNVREEIIGRVNFAPTHGTHKIYIIDEVHMLSTPAFNALLKTLEEPPPHVVFVLCTTDVHKVPETVQARCQRFDFKRLTAGEIVGRLQYICEREGYDHENTALKLIAARSQGGMRDAIRSLEQSAVFSSGRVTYDAVESLLGMVDTEQLFLLCDNLAAGDAAACFSWVSGYVQSGSDIAILVGDLATHVRNLYAVSLVAQTTASSDERLISALELDAEVLPKLRAQAAAFDTTHRLAWILTVLGTLSAELKNAANARLALEIALVRMLNPESETSINALAVRVAALEVRLEAGATGVTRTAQDTKDDPFCHQAAPFCDVQDDLDEDATRRTGNDTGVGAGASPGASGGTGEDKALYRTWNAVVDTIKKQRRGVAANLGGVVPRLSKDGKSLILELPAGANASKQYLETEANQQLLRDTVANAFSEPLEVKLCFSSEKPINISPISEEPVRQSSPEPSKEELESILSNSLNSTIQFKEE